jgi:hypothetical protein
MCFRPRLDTFTASRRLRHQRDAKASLATLIPAGAQGGCGRHGTSALTSHAPNPPSTAFDNLTRELGPLNKLTRSPHESPRFTATLLLSKLPGKEQHQGRGTGAMFVFPVRPNLRWTCKQGSTMSTTGI